MVAEPVRVHFGMERKRGGSGLQDDVVERDLVRVAHRGTQFGRTFEVELRGEVEGRDGADGLGEAAGDGLSDLRQCDISVVATGSHELTAHVRRLTADGGAARSCCFDVALDDASIGAATLECREVDAALAGNAARERRGEWAAADYGGRGKGRWEGGGRGGARRRRSHWRCGWSLRDWRCTDARGCRRDWRCTDARSWRRDSRRRGTRHQRCDVLVLRSDHTDERTHWCCRALSDQPLAQNSVATRHEFHDGLVGFDLGQHVARFHGVAFVLEPLGQTTFLHRRAQGFHENFRSHVYEIRSKK